MGGRNLAKQGPSVEMKEAEEKGAVWPDWTDRVSSVHDGYEKSEDHSNKAQRTEKIASRQIQLLGRAAANAIKASVSFRLWSGCLGFDLVRNSASLGFDR